MGRNAQLIRQWAILKQIETPPEPGQPDGGPGRGPLINALAIRAIVLGELRRWPDYRQTVEQLKKQLQRDDVIDDWTTVLQQHDVPELVATKFQQMIPTSRHAP